MSNQHLDTHPLPTRKSPIIRSDLANNMLRADGQITFFRRGLVQQPILHLNHFGMVMQGKTQNSAAEVFITPFLME